METVSEELLTRIERDLHIGPQFIAVFEPFHTEENARFLLSVINYRRNPTFDSALSIYHLYVSEKSKYTANLSSGARVAIEKYIKTRSEMQKGWGGTGVRLHMGPAKSTLFDTGFADVMLSFKMHLKQTPDQRQALNAFKEKFNLNEPAAAG